MKVYQLTPAENNLIQSYEYEMRALKDIIHFLSEECSDNETLIEKHISELTTKTKESFFCKDDVIAKYHPEKFDGYKINFLDGTLTIYENGEPHED